MFSLNFILGGLFGSVGTYIYKDEKAKQWVLNASKQLKAHSQSFAASCRTKSVGENIAADSATAAVAESAGVVLEK
jgi:hypothetical protein